VVLAIAFTGRNTEITAAEPGSAQQQQVQPPQQPEQAPAPQPEQAPNVAPSPPEQPKAPEQPATNPAAATTDASDASDDFVSIRVTSEPAKADVMLAGQVIGTTPLDIKRPKTGGFAHLTVHKAGYTDYTTKIDMSGDSEKNVELTKLGDAGKKSTETSKKASTTPPKDPKKPAVSTDKDKKTPPVTAPTDKKITPPPPAPPPPAPKCQPPGKYNELDTSCNGQACPPCKE